MPIEHYFRRPHAFGMRASFMPFSLEQSVTHLTAYLLKRQVHHSFQDHHRNRSVNEQVQFRMVSLRSQFASNEVPRHNLPLATGTYSCKVGSVRTVLFATATGLVVRSFGSNFIILLPLRRSLLYRYICNVRYRYGTGIIPVHTVVSQLLPRYHTELCAK